MGTAVPVGSGNSQSRVRANNGTTPFLEFAQVSRVNDGPIIGDDVSAPEIAVLFYTSNVENPGPRTVVTYIEYPRNSPDDKPRFLPLWSSAYETLQFPMLMLHGEAGWSKGHRKESPPFKRPPKSFGFNTNKTKLHSFQEYCRELLCGVGFNFSCRLRRAFELR